MLRNVKNMNAYPQKYPDIQLIVKSTQNSSKLKQFWVNFGQFHVKIAVFSVSGYPDTCFKISVHGYFQESGLSGYRISG